MVFFQLLYPCKFSQILYITIIFLPMIIYGGDFTTIVFMEIIVFLLTIKRTVSNIKCDVATSVIVRCPPGLIVPFE